MKICRTVLSVVLSAGSLRAQWTELVSLGASGAQGDAAVNLSLGGRLVSADGRCACWISDATTFVPGDTNALGDVFVRDRQAGTTERVSVDSAGNEGNGDSGDYGFSMSSDGRFVVFESAANHLVPADTNGVRDIFLRDRQNGTTERVSLNFAGSQADDWCGYPSVSADGRFVAFASLATNLVHGDTNGTWDVFVRDRLNGTTERVSLSSSGAEGNSGSDAPGISADGRFVVLSSYATNLVAGDANGKKDLFVRDRLTGRTEIVSVSTTGSQADQDTSWASITADGRRIAFHSFANNLVSADNNHTADVFVRDRLAGTTELVSLASDGSQSPFPCIGFSISDDGRFVVFHTLSALVPGDTNGALDVYMRDRVQGTTELLSLTSAGAPVSDGHFGAISSGGDFVVFLSDFDNVAPGDTNGLVDLFLKERETNGFTPFCSPGQDGVIACPCGNPPAGAGRGCDNSWATGGATISASGSAALAQDSLVFSTTDQRPTGFSILLQGTAQGSAIVFGQGVRCTGGVHKRLYLEFASGGGIRVPGPGDPSVSARAAALGDPLSPGMNRYYLVYYRDPIVLGGCPAYATWNATNGGSISWW